nr:hypothetical protein [Streptomyces sp. S3(2020)]
MEVAPCPHAVHIRDRKCKEDAPGSRCPPSPGTSSSSVPASSLRGQATPQLPGPKPVHSPELASP